MMLKNFQRFEYMDWIDINVKKKRKKKFMKSFIFWIKIQKILNILLNVYVNSLDF